MCKAQARKGTPERERFWGAVSGGADVLYLHVDRRVAFGARRGGRIIIIIPPPLPQKTRCNPLWSEVEIKKIKKFQVQVAAAKGRLRSEMPALPGCAGSGSGRRGGAQSVRPRTGTGARSALGEAICEEWGWTTPCLLVCSHPVLLLLLWPPLGDPTGCSACRWHL